jgi:predicted secreted protein
MSRSKHTDPKTIRAAKAPAAPRPPIYDDNLGRIAEAVGEIVALKDLMNF